MRKLLLGAMCCAACGSPLDEYVGSYSVAGLSNKLSLNGAPPTTQVLTVPAGLKVIITHDTSSMDVLVLTMGAAELSKASLGSTGMKTLIRSDHVVDSDGCDYFSSWNEGTLLLDGSILTMHRTGHVNRVCVNGPGSAMGDGDQTLQATKDR